MNAEMVRESLARRWPDSEYLSIAEAPQDGSRQGRKIDLLVLSLWASRGRELQAVEIKVSLSDWTRELNHAAKADFWWRHTNRFWVAVPEHISQRVKDTLPEGWGLLACKLEGPPKVLVQAARHEAQPLGWDTHVGLLRAAADAGRTALWRAENAGRRRGIEEGKAAAARSTTEGASRAAYEELRDQVKRFEEASGLTLELGRFDEPANLGQLVAIVRAELRRPGWTAEMLGGEAKRLTAGAEHLAKEARLLGTSAEKVSAAIAAAREAAPPTAEAA